MKINKLNYENYVIDYIEGTLSKELKKDFDLFLEKNEDVYEEIKDYISAPVLEESDEIFTNKKSLKRSAAFKPFYLLALIPFLLGGIYFLSGNNTTTDTKKIKIEAKEVVRQFAQQETEEVKQQINTKVTRQETKVKTEGKQVKKETKNKLAQKQESKVYYAASTNSKENNSKSPQFTIIADEETQVNKNTNINELIADASPKVQSQELLDAVTSLELLPLKSLKNDIDLSLLNATVSSITPKNKSLIDQILENNTWLEMVTPASFDDIDIKESLAIEANINTDRSRKILNAFIPESLVK